jgi:hypothetical protein
MILILSSRTDTHAKHVAQILQKRGHEAVLVSRADFGKGTLLTLDFATHRGELTLGDGTRISSESVSAAWHRRPGAARANDAITDPLDRSFTETEWTHAIDGFFSLIAGRNVSPPAAQRAAIKPFQLALASRVGLRVPDTLITCDPDQALAFVDRNCGAVVHKAMSAPQHQFIDTREWDSDAAEHVADLPLCPTILQEHIRGPGDVRATIVGKHIFSASVMTAEGRAQIDSRLDPDAPWAPCDLPDGVASALLELMDALGLVFGTIDLKLTDSGEHVFLEINPQGQFLYIEILTGLPISEAVADFLALE